MYTLERTQHLPVALDELWGFIQNPANLDEITPPDLSFRIVSAVPEVMFNGLIIEYRLRIPWFGQQRWVTEIKHIREGRSFVDEQRVGPYKLWYHYHELAPEEGGTTRMIDRVHYVLPFGLLGRIVHGLLIRKILKRIFDFRQKRLPELFGAGGEASLDG